jgi:uncharacterized membrane protein (DUF373 family)
LEQRDSSEAKLGREDLVTQALKAGMQRQNLSDAPSVEMLPERDDALIRMLRHIIRFGVRILAVLMTFVILWGVIDVAWVLYQHLMDDEGPAYLLEISDILATFGAFMAVLIAIEIFVNITIYLRDDIIHVKIVMATALMAIARKVIIMDVSKVDTMEIFAIAAVILALSIGYWLVIIGHGDDVSDNGH